MSSYKNAVLFSGAKVAQYSGINLHKQIVAEPAYGKILLC